MHNEANKKNKFYSGNSVIEGVNGWRNSRFPHKAFFK